MKTTNFSKLIPVLAAGMLTTLDVEPASAYRMIQVSIAPGTYSAGGRVRCNDAFGFAHWGQAADSWYLNPRLQGSGKTNAVRRALATWTNVEPAGYRLRWGGTTSRRLNGNDRRNVIVWENSSSLLGPSTHAVTVLTCDWGQEIVDADIVCNNVGRTWTTNGTLIDTQSVLTHELGHAMGIHHTEVISTTTPTMSAFYNSGSGTWPRSLTSDDRQALNCAWIRYYPSEAHDIREEAELDEGRGGRLAKGRPTKAAPSPGLSSRPADRGLAVRFSLARAGHVELAVYDVAGRRVATLLDGLTGAGDHEILWDGTTDRGRAAGGVYFGRLTTVGDETATAKLTVVR